MIIDRDIAWLFISIGLIAISPLVAKLSSRVSKYLLDTYVADETIIVTYKNNGTIESQITIKTKSDGSVASKISKSGSR